MFVPVESIMRHIENSTLVMAKPLHLGMTPWSLRDTHTAQTLGRQAQLGEAWGYQSFWLPEHHFTRGSAIPDPLLLLASVAALTTKIRLGTTSYLLPLRQPLLAAEQVAVLDQLSGGRLTLGIGRGYAPQLFDSFGVDRTRKRKLLQHCLEVMKEAWCGNDVGEGESKTTIAPLPFQQPHPPIWVAAFGPLALKQAGSLGCPYIASPMETIERLHSNLEIHGEACRAANLDVPKEVPIMRTMYCSEDAKLISEVRNRLASESVNAARGAEDTQNVTSIDDWSIVGEPAFVRDVVARYQEELGITHLVVTRLRIGGLPTTDLEKSVALVAETVDR